MMRKLVLGILLLGFVYVPGAMAVDALFEVKAELSAVLAVIKNRDLLFGAVETVDNATYTVNAIESGTHTAGLLAQSAKFTVTGQADQTVNVNVPADFNITGPGGDILVTLTSSSTGTDVLTGGSFIFYVGGTFTLAPTAQIAGTYTSGVDAVTVEIVYN